jgi:hypothetical protein
VWFLPDAGFAHDTLPKSVDGWWVYPMQLSSQGLERLQNESRAVNDADPGDK